MGNYVQIKTSVAELLGIANDLQIKGDAMTTSMQGAIAKVKALEEHPETFPPDEFSDPFLVNYHKPVKGADGTEQPANHAVQGGALKMGEALGNLGQHVENAMWGYTGTDDENASGIAGATQAS
jgi:hypothetical protein